MTAPGAFVKVQMAVYRCTCQRCGHVWHVFGEDPPRACASCKNRGWQELPGVLRRGRPPKKATGETK